MIERFPWRNQNETCSRRPLFRTRKGPKILFEIAKVRNNRSYKKCTHWVKKHKKIIWKLESMGFYTISVLQLKKSLFVVCFLFFVKYFVRSSNSLLELPCHYLKTRKFLKNLQFKYEVKFSGLFDWLFFQAIADIPLLCHLYR